MNDRAIRTVYFHNGDSKRVFCLEAIYVRISFEYISLHFESTQSFTYIFQYPQV